MAMLEYGDEFIVEDALSYLESGGMKEIVLRPKIFASELIIGNSLKQIIELRKYYNFLLYHCLSSTEEPAALDEKKQVQGRFQLVLRLLELLRMNNLRNNDESYDLMTARNIASLLLFNDEFFLSDDDDEEDEDYLPSTVGSPPQPDSSSLLPSSTSSDEKRSLSSSSWNEEQLLTLFQMRDDGEDEEVDTTQTKDTAIHYLETIWLPWLYGLAMDSKVSWISTFASSSTKLATMLIQKEESNSAFSLQVIKPIEVAQVKVFCCCDSAQFFCHALRSVSGVGKSINVWPCVKCGIFLHKVCHPTVVDVDGGIVNYCRNCMPVDPNNGNNVVLMEEEPSFLCV